MNLVKIQRILYTTIYTACAPIQIPLSSGWIPNFSPSSQCSIFHCGGLGKTNWITWPVPIIFRTLWIFSSELAVTHARGAKGHTSRTCADRRILCRSRTFTCNLFPTTAPSFMTSLFPNYRQIQNSTLHLALDEPKPAHDFFSWPPAYHLFKLPTPPMGPKDENRGIPSYRLHSFWSVYIALEPFICARKLRSHVCTWFVFMVDLTKRS